MSELYVYEIAYREYYAVFRFVLLCCDTSMDIGILLAIKTTVHIVYANELKAVSTRESGERPILMCM